MQYSIRIGIVAVVILLLGGCGGHGEGTAKVKAGTIGTLKWEIYEGKSAKPVSKGDRDLTLADVHIKHTGGAYHKMIKLGNHFSVGFAGDPSGLWFVGDRDDQRTLSMEPFDIDSPGHATKKEGSGEIVYKTKTTPNGTEIQRMELLSDVSIAVAKKTDSPLKPSWTIKVLRGSVVVWPALVKGKVVAE